MARSNFMRSNFKSWKSSLWKKAICLKCSTARSEKFPSIFSLPRCTASSRYLSIKWQICTVARELLFSRKAELSTKLSDTGDLNKEGCCFALSVFCNATVVFFMCVKGIHKCRHLCCAVGFLLVQIAYISHLPTEPSYTARIWEIFLSLQSFLTPDKGKLIKSCWKSNKSILPMWSANISTLLNMKV